MIKSAGFPSFQCSALRFACIPTHSASSAASRYSHASFTDHSSVGWVEWLKKNDTSLNVLGFAPTLSGNSTNETQHRCLSLTIPGRSFQ